MSNTTQPDIEARFEYDKLANNIPEIVTIPGTKKQVKICNIKPYTIECLTRLWVEKENVMKITPKDNLKSLCVEPYFAVKEALLFVLNDYWKIRLLYPLLWRIWAKWIGYTEEQMTPIIQMGKKKVPLMAHWTNMVYSVDMRSDWMEMTKKEAEQYRAELQSVAEHLLSKHSPVTAE